MEKAKRILLVSFCLAVSIGAFAQITAGVKAGLNIYDNYQAGTKYYTSTPGAGFHFGVFGNYPFTEKIAARVESLLSTRGVSLSESTLSGVRINYDRQAAYLDFPTYATYNVWDKLNAEAGLVTSVFLNEFRSITTDVEGFKVEEGDQFRSYNRVQFALMAGATYEFTLFNQTFVGGLRYNMGLTPTFELIRDARAGRQPRYMMLQASLAYKILDF
jgi:hypothetical protein